MGKCLNCGIKHDTDNNFCPTCLNLLIQRINIEKIVLRLEEQIKETNSETKLKDAVSNLEGLCVEIRHIDYILYLRKEIVANGG